MQTARFVSGGDLIIRDVFKLYPGQFIPGLVNSREIQIIRHLEVPASMFSLA